MDVVIECCARVDVHQATVVACVLGGKTIPGTARGPGKTTRTFATTRENWRLSPTG